MNQSGQANPTFTCDGCGREFAEIDGTGIRGYAFNEVVTREAATRLITRGGFTPVSVWWCHACFDTRDRRRASRALFRTVPFGPVVGILTYVITLAASREPRLALWLALGIGGPVTLLTIPMYLDHRPCAGRKGGRTRPIGLEMLRRRADKIVRERGFTGFLTLEEYDALQKDPRTIRYPLS